VTIMQALVQARCTATIIAASTRRGFKSAAANRRSLT